MSVKKSLKQEGRFGKKSFTLEEAVKQWGDDAICFETGCDDSDDE